MKKRSGCRLILVALLGSVLVLSACGGGGGGAPAVPASYTGETAQAIITAANAEAIAAAAWNGGMAGDDVGDVVPLAAGGDAAEQTVGEQTPVRFLVEIVQQALPFGVPAIRPAATLSDTLFGDCGGSADFTITTNDVTGAFSGAFTFNDYCSQGTTVAGPMSFSGQVDLNLQIITRISITFNNLLVTDAASSWSYLEGSATFALASDLNSETDTLNLVVRDNLAQKTYWINNYAVHITYGTLSDEVTISGRFYHPDHGFVVLSTEVPMLVGDTPLPTAGVLLLTGDNSRARLTFNGDQSTLLEVDADNDGVFELSLLVTL